MDVQTLDVEDTVARALLAYNMAGTCRVCIAPKGPSTDPKDFTLDAARLKVTEDPGRACLYDAEYSLCTSDAYADASSTECMVATAAYCAAPFREGMAEVAGGVRRFRTP